MRKIIALAILAIIQCGPACAKSPNLFVDGGENALLATKGSFSIAVSDQASDGCLPRPNALKDKMEISLRKNGFEIQSEALFKNEISITVLGYETSSKTCAISLAALLEFPIVASVPHAREVAGGDTTILYYQFPIGNALLTGPKTDMQERAEKMIAEYGDRLFLRISRARDEIFKKFPAIRASFENSGK